MLGASRHPTESSIMSKRFFAFLACMLLSAWSAPSRAVTVLLEPSADTSLYEVAVGNAETANSRGQHLFAGRITTGERRRALLKFDLSGLPADATVTSAQLSMSLTRDPPGMLPAVNFSLFRVTSAWSEGGSDAGDPGGNGTVPTVGDPTWTQRAFPSTPWMSAGGDIVATASAVTSAGVVARYQWGSTPIMVSDVQSWLTTPAGNLGWALLADEGAGTLTARRFASREAATAATRPLLLIEYTTNIGPPDVARPIPALSTLGLIALLLSLAWAVRHRLRMQAMQH
jgi:hypothetical protein